MLLTERTMHDLMRILYDRSGIEKSRRREQTSPKRDLPEVHLQPISTLSGVLAGA
jgi:hypothetical protein